MCRSSWPETIFFIHWRTWPGRPRTCGSPTPPAFACWMWGGRVERGSWVGEGRRCDGRRGSTGDKDRQAFDSCGSVPGGLDGYDLELAVVKPSPFAAADTLRQGPAVPRPKRPGGDEGSGTGTAVIELISIVSLCVN